MKFEVKKIRKGGRRNIFKQKFDLRAGEKLLKASHCFFSIETGAVAGLLFISTEKIAFCSQRSIAFNFPILQQNQTVEQVNKYFLFTIFFLSQLGEVLFNWLQAVVLFFFLNVLITCTLKYWSIGCRVRLSSISSLKKDEDFISKPCRYSTRLT